MADLEPNEDKQASVESLKESSIPEETEKDENDQEKSNHSSASSVTSSTDERRKSVISENEPESSPQSSTSSSPTTSSSDNEQKQETLSAQMAELKKKIYRNPLEDLTHEDLARTVSDLHTEVKHLTIENDMFERYLTVNDPVLLEGMAQTVENALKMQGTEPVRRATLVDDYSVKSYTSVGKTDNSIVGTSSILEKGPRINLTQKNDIIMKQSEELQRDLNKFYKEAHKRQCTLKAHLEEIEIELIEVTTDLDLFEQIVVIEGLDPLTQRIPAEKFVRFLHEWLKMASATIQKFRLRQSTLSAHLRRLKITLKQKKELGESLHAVDFEKLQIENNHFVKEIDLRTLQLIDLKRMNGEANLILTNQKKFLMKQIVEMQDIQRDIDETKTKIEDLEVQTDEADEQLDKVRLHYENIRQMIEEYKVPDVMDYVRIKGSLYEVQKNIKIWSRRSHLQNVALNSSIREMKNITGSRKVLDSWFRKKDPHEKFKYSYEDDDDDDNSSTSDELKLNLQDLE